MRFLGKQPPLLWVGLGIVAALAAAALYIIPPWTSAANLLIDALAFGLVLVVGLAAISQFILPVQTGEQRREAFDHFWHYVAGSAGPIVFVREGKVVGRKDELQRQGHGVALVDSASAIVLEKSSDKAAGVTPAAQSIPSGKTIPQPAQNRPLVRSVGPGVVFIKPGERVAAALDLRRQSRGTNAQAMTRDFIECGAYISVTFALDQNPERRPGHIDRHEPPFPFNPSSAFWAIYGAALGEQPTPDWTALPLMVAVECFRDLLSEYHLDALFSPTTAGSDPFQSFRGRVAERVRDASLLRERGIAVYGVGVSELTLPREVLNQRVRSWQARWQHAAIQREALVEQRTITKDSAYQADTQSKLFHEVQTLLANTQDKAARQALAHVLVRALQRAAADPLVRDQLEPESLNTLQRLKDWVK